MSRQTLERYIVITVIALSAKHMCNYGTAAGDVERRVKNYQMGHKIKE